jgi:argininosuccinate synthase
MGLTVADLKGKTVAMAVSGGLDSCTITKWLSLQCVRVYCFTADLGQPDEPDLEVVRKRMLACGAADAFIIDAKPEIARAGMKVVQYHARYEGGYFNTTGIARHITVKKLLPEIIKMGIHIFGHGATGRGNDQVRFELAPNMLFPEISVFAPWRKSIFIKELGGRKEMIHFCREVHNLPIVATLEKPYSTDPNMLGLTHEAGELEKLTTPAYFVEPGMGVYPWNASDKSEYVTIVFENGIPVKLVINGNEIYLNDLVTILQKANEVGGRNGIHIGLHVVENRFVGIKSRGVYEAPGLEILDKCFQFLLQTILDRRARRFYDEISVRLAEQIYQGYWFDPASQMLRAALNPILKLVSGTVTVRLYKGNIFFTSITDVPHSLYSEINSSMEKIGSFNHEDSEGFLHVLSVSAKALSTAGQIDIEEE